MFERVALWFVVLLAAFVPSGPAEATKGDTRVSPSTAAGFTLAAGAIASLAPHAWTFSASDTVVARDDGVVELFALEGMLLYGRFEVRAGNPPDWRPAGQRRWMRVVDGRRLRARGMPTDSEPISIGRDGTGRVVAVLRRTNSDGTADRLWLYDIARDTARRLHVRARHGCAVQTVAIWRRWLTAVERCGQYKSYVVLHQGASTRRLTGNISRGGYSKLYLRGRSLAVIGEYGPFEQTVWRVVDRGRRCPKAIAGAVEEYGIWGGIGSSALTWAIAGYNFDGSPTFSGLQIRNVDLSGRCEPSPRTRITAPSLLPQGTIHGLYWSSGPAIDGRTLYYATDTAIHKLRLRPRGEATPRLIE